MYCSDPDNKLQSAVDLGSLSGPTIIEKYLWETHQPAPLVMARPVITAEEHERILSAITEVLEKKLAKLENKLKAQHNEKKKVKALTREKEELQDKLSQLEKKLREDREQEEKKETRIKSLESQSFSFSRFFQKNQLAEKNTKEIDTSPVIKKLCIIGDGGTGKTALLYRLKNNVFDPEYEPTIFETDTLSYQFEGQQINLK